MTLRHVDLCSGIGGFALGFEWAKLSKPVLFCDIEPWSRQILAKHWPDVPIATDVKELANDPDGLVPDCDILTAGYPCQPFSLAGERRGTEDDRHIWPYIFSIIQRKRPSFCVFENVYGHVTLGLDEVLSDLERESYATRPFIVPACATDAPHRRDRLWIICRNVADTRRSGCNTRGNIETRKKTVRSKPTSFTERSGQDVAYAQSLFSNVGREHTEQSKRQVSKLGERGGKINVADTDSEGSQGQWREHEPISRQETGHAASYSDKEIRARKNWQPEPRVGRVAHGIPHWLDEPGDIPRVVSNVPNRVNRLKGLGNAIIPQIAMRIGLTIKETM